MKHKKHANNMEEMAENTEKVDKTANEHQPTSGNENVDDNSAESSGDVNEGNDVLIDELQAEINDQKNKYARLMAEFENYKRRTNQEKLDIIQTAGKDILISMLEILDDMDRAEKQIEQDTDLDHVKEGVMLIFNKFRNMMNAKGVKSIDTLNADFDTEMHEAIANVPAPSPEMAGKIIDEVQKGYTLNDKIIRFPKVVVGN